MISCVDAPNIYFVPLNLRDEGLDRLVVEKLGLETEPPQLDEWIALVERLKSRDGHRADRPGGQVRSTAATPI